MSQILRALTSVDAFQSHCNLLTSLNSLHTEMMYTFQFSSAESMSCLKVKVDNCGSSPGQCQWVELCT